MASASATQPPPAGERGVDPVWRLVAVVVLGAWLSQLAFMLVSNTDATVPAHGNSAQHHQPSAAAWGAAPASMDQCGGAASTMHSSQQSDIYFHQCKQLHYVLPDRLKFESTEVDIGMVADLDHASRDPEKFLWKSYLKTAKLVRNAGQDVNGHPTFHVRWDPEMMPLYSKTATGNRSMELSELVRFRHLLLALCDKTGLVFKIVPGTSDVFQRYAIADGNGEQPKPFKGEWATVKDGMIWFGSMGREWTDSNGVVLNRDSEWVKTVDLNGRIENYDWGPVYAALRTAAGMQPPGYLWHEAVHWDARDRRWVFLPRKASTKPYDEVSDETKGTNLLITASEDFSQINVTRVGPLEHEYGFAAVRKLPGSEDIFLALKVKEIGTVTHTKMGMFALDGTMLLQGGAAVDGWEHVDTLKFEGLEFL